MKICKSNFFEFTYSKLNHFEAFAGLDVKLYKKKQDPFNCDLKVYQDLLVFAFIIGNIPKGSRILEIGGGNSRIIGRLKRKYKFWNLDKLAGVGHGPKKIKVKGFKLVKDYIGSFNPKLPDGFFDLVFSISVLEHVPQDDDKLLLFKNILDDTDRILKPGGFSLHCVDAIMKKGVVWIHPLLPFIFQNRQTVNPFIDPVKVRDDPDVFFMSAAAYQNTWERVTGKKYEEFGHPFSYNVLWQKAYTGK